MRVSSFVFDTRLYQGERTLVYAGVREVDGVRVVGKLVEGGARDLHVELSILDKVSGPGVVEALGLVDSSQGPMLVQRRFGDRSLAQALESGPLSPRRALSIALQLARVLQRIHTAGVLHRDVKPANVLLDSHTDTIALADFGIAVELPVGVRSLAISDLVGTPAYISPEQTGRTREHCDARSDLYSLGVTVYQLLTGKLPFPADDTLDLVAAHLTKTPERPELCAPAVPAQLGAIVMKLLAKSADERYQSARGLAIDLSRALETMTAEGEIPAFELARSDRMPFRAGSKVHGRGAERNTLAAALDRAQTGTPTLVLLSGRPGSGRNELVHSLVSSEVGEGPVAMGRWNAAGEQPLAGVSEALGSLAGNLLLLDDDELTNVRAKLMAAVGQVGQVMVDIAPALADVLGPQPELPTLEPVAARGRLQHAFRRFAHALGEDRTFVLVLENVEHADLASLQLVEALLAEGETSRVLLILTATEVSAFGSLRERAGTVAIELGPLTIAAVSAWAQDLLGSELERTRELSEVLHEKAAGNPGMLAALLEHFLHSGLIERTDGAYTWDLDEVRAAKPPPSLDALSRLRVDALPADQQALLAAVARAEVAAEPATLGLMLQRDTSEVDIALRKLEREGLVTRSASGVYAISDHMVAAAALKALPSGLEDALQGRLALHLLRTLEPSALPAHAMQIALALSHSTAQLPDDELERAASSYALAAERATAVMAYDTAALFFQKASQLLGPDAWTSQRALAFRLEIGLARSLMMLARHAEAERLLSALCSRELLAEEIGVAYPSRSDNRNVVMDRAGAVEVGLEGLARLGFEIPAEPTQPQAVAPLFENHTTLEAMSLDDHLRLPALEDPKALAAIKIISTMSLPLAMCGRSSLYVMTLSIGLSLSLKQGHTRYYASFLSTHAMILHSRLNAYDAARRAYEACQAVQRARPAPEIDGRTYLVLYYLIRPWFSPWSESLEPLESAIQLGVEAGDPLFAAISASASITLLSMCGAPLDRILAKVEGWSAIFEADGGVAANAANVRNIAGKLVRGEAIEQTDLDRISAVPVAAGAMRNNAMVNFGLALIMVGHEAQVRSWIDEVRVSFPLVNAAQPHLVSLWLLEGILAANDVHAGRPERASETERIVASLQKLQEQTKSDQHVPAIALLAAELAAARGEIDHASGLYGRAASEARARELTPLVAYAMERRAGMLERAGLGDEAALFLREAAIAYRRWGNRTKVQQLEALHPELRALDMAQTAAAHGATRRATSAARGPLATQQGTINDSLDLSTVLKVSQQISTQLHASAVVRAVLQGIAQNAGAERALFVLRDKSGADRLYGEVQGEHYRELSGSADDEASMPQTAFRIARRTARPLVLNDASSHPNHGLDTYVIQNSCRSIALVPVLRGGAVAGFIVLENRLVAGAFTPQLVSLTQALVAQAAISLENAALYEDMEQRVQDRTAALNTLNAELRMVFDNVAQGLVMVDMSARLSSEASAVLAKWYPEGIPPSLDAMFANDWTFRAGWDQLLDGFLPAELCIDQLPKHLRKGDQIFEVGWRPIFDGQGTVQRMLVVLSDITEALRRQEVEREQRQMMAIFERLSQDRQGVIEFAKEASSILAQIARADSSVEVEKRLVHTLKGNSAFFGLSGLSTLCHDIESAMSLDARGLSADERSALSATWGAIDARLGRFLDVGGNYLHVRRPDFESALRALVREGHPIAQDLELWKLEALETRFQRIEEQAHTLADRLGKGPIRVALDHGGFRISADLWAPLWASFVHAIRNAIDHGLETPDERAALGKGIATLSLRAYFIGASFVVELGDDGRGVAWDKVRAKALAAGLPHSTHAELLAALLCDGMSTKDVVDELSGRGVGMAALADACAAMSGTIAVESSAGVGTTWRFEFPSDVARLPRERRSSLVPSGRPANSNVGPRASDIPPGQRQVG